MHAFYTCCPLKAGSYLAASPAAFTAADADNQKKIIPDLSFQTTGPVAWVYAVVSFSRNGLSNSLRSKSPSGGCRGFMGLYIWLFRGEI
jgi:hypothetical protein